LCDQNVPLSAPFHLPFQSFHASTTQIAALHERFLEHKQVHAYRSELLSSDESHDPENPESSPLPAWKIFRQERLWIGRQSPRLHKMQAVLLSLPNLNVRVPVEPALSVPSSHRQTYSPIPEKYAPCPARL